MSTPMHYEREEESVRYAKERQVLELTRRNLETLLAKLDDPASARTLIDPSGSIAVVAVENDAHYKTRQPGDVYMPTTGEWR